jgi:hypothetical protein
MLRMCSKSNTRRCVAPVDRACRRPYLPCESCRSRRGHILHLARSVVFRLIDRVKGWMIPDVVCWAGDRPCGWQVGRCAQVCHLLLMWCAAKRLDRYLFERLVCACLFSTNSDSYITPCLSVSPQPADEFFIADIAS